MKLGWMVRISVVMLAGTAASAQEAYYWPAPGAQNGPLQRTYYPIGTPLALRTRTEANTKQMKPGDRVHLEVTENLIYRGQIVVPVGAPAVGEVMQSERNGHFGKRGYIAIRLIHLQTPHGPVRIEGETSSQGKSASGWSIPGAVLVAWPLMFVHGTSGYIRQGTMVNAYLSEPLTFGVQQPAEQTMPMVVQAQDPRPLPAFFDPGGAGGQDVSARSR